MQIFGSAGDSIHGSNEFLDSTHKQNQLKGFQYKLCILDLITKVITGLLHVELCEYGQ